MILALLILATVAGPAAAQGRGGGARAGGPPPTARAQAPKDFTGYWVAVVTEHWHLRMEMPPKNDFSDAGRQNRRPQGFCRDRRRGEERAGRWTRRCA